MLFLQNQVILGLSPMDFSLLVGGFYFIACLSIGSLVTEAGELLLMAPVFAVLAFLVWPAIILVVAILMLALVMMLIGWAVKAIFTPSKSPPVAE